MFKLYFDNNPCCIIKNQTSYGYNDKDKRLNKRLFNK